MGNTKMTAREFYSAVIEANISDEMNAKAKELIEALDRKNEKRKTSETSNQKANSELKNQIVENLKNGIFETVEGCITSKILTTYMNKNNPDFDPEKPFTSQKSTALLSQLAKDSILEMKEVKTKSGKVKGYYLTNTQD